MKVWLLAQIAGVSATPGFLLEQSKCLQCLNEGQLRAIQSWLLCQIVNAECPPCPPEPVCPGVTLSNVTLPDSATISYEISGGFVVVSVEKDWTGVFMEDISFTVSVSEGCCAWLGSFVNPRSETCGVFSGGAAVVNETATLNGTTIISGLANLSDGTPCEDPFLIDPTPWIVATSIDILASCQIANCSKLEFKFAYNAL